MQVTYYVRYPFAGFLQPVDNPPTLNTSQAGRAIPVKFRLGDDRSLNVLATGSPSVQTISCATSAPLDEIEEASTAGASTLRYDPLTMTYTYVWATSQAWAGTCRRFTLHLADATTHYADFKFR